MAHEWAKDAPGVKKKNFGELLETVQNPTFLTIKRLTFEYVLQAGSRLKILLTLFGVPKSQKLTLVYIYMKHIINNKLKCRIKKL